MFGTIKSLLLQISEYVCSSEDKKELEIIQWKIKYRLDYLKENNLDEFNDSELLQYYDIHRQIQNCIAQDPTETIFILSIGLIAVIGIVAVTWIMVNKVNPKKI